MIVKDIKDDELEQTNKDPNYLVINTFDLAKDIHTRMDIRQFHATKLGMQLLPEEMNIEFYPDEFKNIFLPQNYVVAHPVKTWPSRTWEEDKWQKFINKMYDNNIPVVAIGKSSSEPGTFNTQKPTFDIDIKNGINLLNELSLHQTWHILNKSTVVVTMDSGILHLAGTTDTGIIQLGSSINPKLRAPYRNNSQEYKYKYIDGECKLLCASNPSYFLKYNGIFNKMAPVPFCLERPETFGNQEVNDDIYKCHPSVNDISEEAIRMYHSYKKVNTEAPNQQILTENKGKIVF